MSRHVVVVGLTILMGACAASVNPQQEGNALLARDREWSQSTRDVNRFKSFLATNASMYATGMPVVTGADAIGKMFTEMSSAPGFSLSWAPSKADVSGTGDMGYTAGAYTAVTAGATEKGKYVTVWRKQAGVWMVAEDIFNADGSGPVPAHVMMPASALKWGPPPPGLPAGGRVALVAGDPSQAVPFSLMVQVPAGYKIALHWHPTTENLVVVSGTVALAMDKADAPMKDLPAGSVAVLPAEMRHVFAAKTAATFEVHGIGPFAINYVNAGDDPRTKK